MQKEKSTASTSSRPFGKSSKESLQAYDIPVIIARMKQNGNYSKGGLASMTLTEIPGKKIVLTALQQGVEIQSNLTNESVTLLIIEGEVSLSTDNQTLILQKGKLLTLFGKTQYSLSMLQESVLLLTITSAVLPDA